MRRYYFVLFVLCFNGYVLPAFSAPDVSTDAEKVDRLAGSDDEMDLYKIFLRQSMLILEPGQFEGEVDLGYSKDSYYGVDVREFTLPVVLRAGIAQRIEGYLEMPMIWKERKLTSGTESATIDDSGLGDLSFGLKVNLCTEQGARPDIVLSLSGVAPTGNEPDYRNSDVVNLGDGQWKGAAALSFVKSSDPVVLFAGVGYTYVLDETLHGQDVHQDGIVNYNFGMGFSINHEVTISGQFLGAYQNDLELDGIVQQNTSSEPMSMRVGVTYRLGRSQYLEPSITYGLNDDASDTILNIAYSRTF